jgi:uncharacterized protein YraI
MLENPAPDDETNCLFELAQIGVTMIPVKKRNRIIPGLLVSLLAACSTAPTVRPSTAVPIYSPSPVASPTLTPSPRPPTATPTATPVLFEGTLTTKVNLRSGPGIEYDSLAVLDSGATVQVIQQDASGSWYMLSYPSGPGGIAWVASRYVAVLNATSVPFAATATPAGLLGTVLQRLNVRSGPGTSFETLGTIEPNATVTLTGKDGTASWFQINYPDGPSGRAWVTAQYIQTDISDQLPVLDNYGTPVSSGGSDATPVAMTPTPTIGPAYADGDSAKNPSAKVVFSATGTLSFTYTGQVSAPEGDPEDWVAFTPFTYEGTTARLEMSLTCAGNGDLTVELIQNGAAMANWGSLACGDESVSITLETGQEYLLHIQPTAGASLRLVTYTLTVQDIP